MTTDYPAPPSPRFVALPVDRWSTRMHPPGMYLPAEYQTRGGFVLVADTEIRDGGAKISRSWIGCIAGKVGTVAQMAGDYNATIGTPIARWIVVDLDKQRAGSAIVRGARGGASIWVRTEDEARALAAYLEQHATPADRADLPAGSYVNDPEGEPPAWLPGYAVSHLVHKCASPTCPGLPYRASDAPHPCPPAVEGSDGWACPACGRLEEQARTAGEACPTCGHVEIEEDEQRPADVDAPRSRTCRECNGDGCPTCRGGGRIPLDGGGFGCAPEGIDWTADRTSATRAEDPDAAALRAIAAQMDPTGTDPGAPTAATLRRIAARLDAARS